MQARKRPEMTEQQLRPDMLAGLTNPYPEKKARAVPGPVQQGGACEGPAHATGFEIKPVELT